MSQRLDAIRGTVEERASRTAGTMSEAVTALGATIEEMRAAVEGSIDQRLTEMATAIEDAAARASETATSVRAAVAERLDALREELRSDSTGMTEQVRTAVDASAGGRIEELASSIRSTLDEGLRGAGDAVSSVRQRIDEMGVNVGEFGTSLAAELTKALDRAREDAPDVEDILAAVRTQLDETLGRGQATVEQLRVSVEQEVGQLRDQVAYGMAALLRQMDAIRGRAPGTPGEGPQRPSA